MTQQLVDDLLEQVHQSADHFEKVTLLESAARAADSVGDDSQSYDIRMELVESATWSDRYDRALVAFSWCLAHHDRLDAPLNTWTLLWRFKWVLGNASLLPSVTHAQIEALESDMERRLEAGGYNRRTIEYLRLIYRSRAGRLVSAEKHYKSWKQTPRDSMSDCQACEHDSECEYYQERGEYEKALVIGRKLVEGKLGGCQEVPQQTYGRVIRMLIALDLLDEAEARHKAGIGLIAGKREYLGCLCDHLLLMVRTKEHSRALRLINRHLRYAHETVDGDTQMWFYHTVALTLESLGWGAKVMATIRLPTEHPLFNASQEYDSDELAKWYDGEATLLAKAFDQRNDNQAYTERLCESRRLACVD